MSVIHINQIRKRLDTLFKTVVDMSDQKPGTKTYDDMLLSRSLAAYAIHHLAGCDPEAAAGAIIDGANDNGIDAIYFDESETKLYVVQAKWIHDGKGEPDNGSVKKFIAGIHDLLSLNLDRFNEKVITRQDEIGSILSNAGLQIIAILVHTGNADTSIHSLRDFEDLLKDVNDASEILSWLPLNQGLLHKSLTEDLNSPITADIAVHYWGKVQEPRYAIYGQVSANDLGQIWLNHKDRVLTKNLRGALGDTDVNSEIRTSLEKNPELFWYFNNGVTATATHVEKLPLGGGKHELGYFHCEGIHIVNGAQTVSTIGRFLERNPTTDLSNCFVQFRVVSLQDGGEEFGDEVTKTNNRQNKIEARDFVSQDPEQKRIRTELLIDDVHYQIMRSDDLPRGGNVFDLQDSTTAIACASGDIGLVVTLKSQIGKLWEDTSKRPYVSLFNPSVSGLHVWRCIQTQRMIDIEIDKQRPKYRKPRESKILTYGNRLIAALVFSKIAVNRFNDPKFDFEKEVDGVKISAIVVPVTYGVVMHVQRFFSNAMIPTFFKNQTKCREVFEIVGRAL
jgi:hypothetical protein